MFGIGARPEKGAGSAKSASPEMGVGFDVTCELTRLADGEAARVVGFAGEADGARLESMGILVGSIVEKKSTALRNGPVVVERGRTQLALAYCIAQGILVEPLR